MYLYKRIGDAFKFLAKNPWMFAVYLPLALLSFIGISLDSTYSIIWAIIYTLLLFVISSFVFTIAILETYYHEHRREPNFEHTIKTASSKFLTLLIAEVLLVIVVSIFSMIADYFAQIFTSNLGQAFTIVFFLAFLGVIIKVALFASSSVLKGTLGFIDSWKIVNGKRFLELGIFLILYAVLSYGISALNLVFAHLGDFMTSLILGPIVMIVLTMLYLDYTR